MPTPPPKTIRQKLVDAIVARMNGINGADPYQTTPLSVEEWATHYQEDELTNGYRLSVCDMTNEPQTQSRHDLNQANRLKVQVRVFTSSATRVTDLRQIIGDVLTAIRTDQFWGGLAQYSEPGQDGFIVPQESAGVAGAAVEFIIVYGSQRFDAFE
ncbi:MAG TPA: hypothetical protein VHU19_14250 [Pyrinomonadaceae bacterium]|jgi:hypothetical protein|nr:hypothetical protein [Pyrinomonadaceae bacterium]